MKKSAFDKWYDKKGFVYEGNSEICEKAWLAALQWALKQKIKPVKDGNATTFSSGIDTDKIKAEIKASTSQR